MLPLVCLFAVAVHMAVAVPTKIADTDVERTVILPPGVTFQTSEPSGLVWCACLSNLISPAVDPPQLVSVCRAVALALY